VLREPDCVERHSSAVGALPGPEGLPRRPARRSGLSGAGLSPGHAHGLAVAGALLDLRKNDPTTGDDGYAASVSPGSHRPDPDNPGQGYHAPNYGARAACFAVNMRHTLDPPPAIGSLEYNDALVEVRAKGIAPDLMGTLPQSAAARPPARP
jgi:hypothetical protein